MNSAFHQLAALLLCLAVGSYYYRTQPIEVPDIKLPLSHNDSQGIFAVGKRINLSCADLYSLELVPGLGPTLARNILSARADIISRARQLSPEERFSALSEARQVGETTALKLGAYISPIDGVCPLDGPFLEWP